MVLEFLCLRSRKYVQELCVICNAPGGENQQIVKNLVLRLSRIKHMTGFQNGSKKEVKFVPVYFFTKVTFIPDEPCFD